MNSKRKSDKLENQIMSIKVRVQIYDVMKMQPGNTWITVLLENEIITYYTEFGSRKQIDICKTTVDKCEMIEFFGKVYEFVRSAESFYLPVDDCSYMVTITYGPLHYEVIEGETVKGDRSLVGMIEEFVKTHR